MRPVIRFFLFLLLAILCFLAAGGVTLAQVTRYNDSLDHFPGGSTIAGIPVGGLDEQAASTRLAQVFSETPLELRIDGSPVQINPKEAGQQLDIQGMLASAKQEAAAIPYWTGFWNSLWNQPVKAFETPLICSVASDQLHTYLQQQIVTRYSYPPQPAAPIPGDVRFTAGHAGTVLNLDQKETEIASALCSADARVVTLTTTAEDEPAPQLTDLKPMLEALTQVSKYDGVIEVYFQDLKTGQEVNYAFNQGQEIAPEVAFTGASTIKIPVMISTYKKIEGPLSDDLQQKMGLMIDLSDNNSTDAVMEDALDENLGPLQVTEDMVALGLKNTFLAGFFYQGAPLLQRFETPANQRTDLSTDPDIYNQTTAVDIGRLLAAIQRCSADGNGPLIDTFKGQITQEECQSMTGLLAKNRKGTLLEAGLPEGTNIAHKYGWVLDTTDGLLHNASDAAIISTPGGDFILTVYLYHPIQLPWDDAQRLVARLATAVNNFYNGWK